MSRKESKGELKEVVESENNQKIFEWLIARPFILQIHVNATKNNFIISHAGIPEIWSVKKAQDLAQEISKALISNPSKILQSMWGNEPKSWDDTFIGNDRYRIIINYFTRMRFLDDSASLDLENTSTKASKGFKPWFNYESNCYKKMRHYYVFGHWASLKGRTNNPHFIGLDTGCVWEGELTALRLNDLKKISVKY